jgi:excisionase family DNA binding protein
MARVRMRASEMETMSTDPQEIDEGRDLGYTAKAVGLSPHTVRALARRRELSHYKLGRRLIFRDSDIAEYLRRHRVEARA